MCLQLQQYHPLFLPVSNKALHFQQKSSFSWNTLDKLAQTWRATSIGLSTVFCQEIFTYIMPAFSFNFLSSNHLICYNYYLLPTARKKGNYKHWRKLCRGKSHFDFFWHTFIHQKDYITPTTLLSAFSHLKISPSISPSSVNIILFILQSPYLYSLGRAWHLLHRKVDINLHSQPMHLSWHHQHFLYIYP